ncbi:FAD/NAD(P)-binding protein [Rhizobium panacihumi]|uniref:FAD/NAD(P)-binding protein n=1 Tax=Rhizobium panacihumi TaxID=2008450 RepID=UPI003D7A2B2E
MTAETDREHIPDRPTVAIIGGGATGAAVAYHLAKHGAEADIVVVEPREELGRGLAYSSLDRVHRINVPAARMSLLPDHPEHFIDWIAATAALEGDDGAIAADGNAFPQRRVFGAYLHASVKPLMDKGLVRHVRSAVTGVTKDNTRWHVTDSAGHTLAADIVVIATTHPAPSAPARLAQALAGHPRFIADPTPADALGPVRKDDRVLVVGNGLTSADVIVSLKERGHYAHITALSRRGLRSRGHAPCVQEPFGDFLSPPPSSARDLLSRIRAAIRGAARQGMTWHAVLDQVRAQGSAVWAQLDEKERRRIVRHLRVYWDVHRFRIAPQVEAVLDRETAEGRLEVLAAHLLDVTVIGETIHVSVRPRGARHISERVFDAVVVTTGPAHGRILQSQQWLRELGQRGHLQNDRIGLGLACNGEARAISADGTADSSLFIAGPLGRGHFGELMGFPQVAESAVLVANSVAAVLQKHYPQR